MYLLQRLLCVVIWNISRGQYDLGDLWPAVVRAWKDRLNDAKESAITNGPDGEFLLARCRATQRFPPYRHSASNHLLITTF
jgi:hypothetical protein